MAGRDHHESYDVAQPPAIGREAQYCVPSFPSSSAPINDNESLKGMPSQDYDEGGRRAKNSGEAGRSSCRKAPCFLAVRGAEGGAARVASRAPTDYSEAEG